MELTEQQMRLFARMFANEFATSPTGSAASFARAMRYAKHIAEDEKKKIQNAIASGKATFQNHDILYVTKIVGNATPLFESKVNERKGLVTLNQGKLQKDEYFAPSSMRAKIGIGSGTTTLTDDELRALPFVPINTLPVVETGELNIDCGGSVKLVEKFALSAFDTTGNTTIIESTVFLDNPVVFTPLTQWNGSLAFDTTTGLPPNGYFWLKLSGTKMTL